MGLAQIALKSIFAALSVLAAVFAYSIGEQHASVEGSRDGSSLLIEPLRAERSRAALISAVQENAAGDFSEQIGSLARRAPLDPLPFEVELARALSSGAADEAEILARQAKARQPRSLAARLYGLSVAAQSGNYSQVLDDYERLIELRAIDGNILSDALIGVFRAGGDWSDLIEYVAGEPATGGRLLSRLMNETVAVDDLERLIAIYPDYQGRYLNSLSREGSYSRAYSAWRRFANLSDEAVMDLPFNGRFEDRPEPTPFNWSISRDRAEYQSRGGLYVTYLGTERPLMARQVLTAPPGDFILRTELQGRMPEAGGALEWTLICLGTNQRLANSILQLQTIGEREVFEETVTVPDEGCPFQRLDLWGRSGEFPKTSRTEIYSVQLIRFSE